MSRIGHEEPMEEFARFPMDASFKVFRRFNRGELEKFAGVRGRIDRRALELFDGDSMPEKIARAIVRRQAIVAKELFESFEFFQRVRRGVRQRMVVDVSAGHGLTGLLFAAFEREVEEVILVDPTPPDSFEKVSEAVYECAPWAREKVRYIENRVEYVHEHVEEGAGIFGVHACGVLSDRAIDLAIKKKSTVALLPCCYAQTAQDAPRALREWLGAEMTTDVHRTYRLEDAGYDVVWTAIPRVITPKNRVILARPR
jgi:16S rRNA G527 N7-methylase RsmG